MNRTAATKQTADDAYTLRREQVEQAIHDLQQKLAALDAQQAAAPRDWSYAGTMAHIAGCLNNALGNEA